MNRLHKANNTMKLFGHVKEEVRSGKRQKKSEQFFENHVRYGTKRAMSLMMWIEVASNSCVSVAASAFDNALEHSSALRGTHSFSFGFVLFSELPICIYLFVSLQLYDSSL